MAQMVVRKTRDTYLDLENPDSGLYQINHIYEPEYHQDAYVSICEELSKTKGAYQLNAAPKLIGTIHRGVQPLYADDETDAESLYWQGMTRLDGTTVKDKSANICALKSICIRAGYVDLETARSVNRAFYEKNKSRAGIKKNDVLINSTGDGTIGRVAVFNHDFSAVVDGHITILRFSDPNIAWYIGAYLMSDFGQRQIIRYINGSSGQVEIYPQDIGRIWIKPASEEKIKKIACNFRNACDQYNAFTLDIKRALNAV